MNSLKYGIIGKNWGYTIFKILRSMNKNCIFLNIKSPKKYKSQSEYKNICSKIIKDTSKNVDIIWIAVPSNEKFYLVNECIKNDLNIILEKPWLYSLVKSKKKVWILQGSWMTIVRDFYHDGNNIPSYKRTGN